MTQIGPRVLSRPHRVVFAGWETTTTALQQAGWSLSAEEDVYRSTIRLAMRFQPARLYMLSEATRHDYFERMCPDAPITFHVRYVTSDLRVELRDDFRQFRPIDAEPQIETREVRSIEDLRIFAAPLTRTEEIIVEPSTVMDLLEKIKSMQAPDLAAIRERNRKRYADRGSMDHGAIEPRKFHAQIVSLAA